MAYGASNVYFADQDLNITTYNSQGPTGGGFTGATQSYVLPGNSSPTVFQTQNSFQTLIDVLGARPLESSDYVGSSSCTVADPSAVDPACFNLAADGQGIGSLPPPTLHVSSALGAVAESADTLSRLGDYHVYQLNVNTSGNHDELINVQGSEGLSPVLFVLGSEGAIEKVVSAGTNGSFNVS